MVISVAAPETVYVKPTKVSCDGGEGALGHPRVYLNMGDHGMVECPYCDRRFILGGGPKDMRGQAD
ncbi:MAG: zinc-finger domain-containing protein [Sphingomonadales bacterium]